MLSKNVVKKKLEIKYENVLGFFYLKFRERLKSILLNIFNVFGKLNFRKCYILCLLKMINDGFFFNIYLVRIKLFCF